MSKSTKATKKGKGGKSKKEKQSLHEVPLPETPKEPEPEVPKDIRVITITVGSFQNIAKNYPAATIEAKCEFRGQIIGQTGKTPLLDDGTVIPSTESAFQLDFDLNNPKSIDDILSNPLIVCVTEAETPSELSDSLAASGDATSDLTGDSTLTKDPFDSAISLYEALTGDIVERKTTKGEGGGKKKAKRSKSKSSDGKVSRQSSKTRKKKKSLDKKSSKSSSKSKNTKKSKDTLTTKIKPIKEEPMKIIGHCLIDLLPIFLGTEEFSEFFYLIPPKVYQDERMVPFKKKPGILLTVSINTKIDFPCKSNIVKITFESIFNIPSLMAEMDVAICLSIPYFNQTKHPTVIKNGVLKTTPVVGDVYKFWPDMEKSYLNSMKYKLNSDELVETNIKTDLKDLDFEKILSSKTPRIEYNCLKRIFLVKEGYFSFYDQLKTFRNVVLEIYGYQKNEKIPADRSSVSSKSKGKGKKGKSVSSTEMSGSKHADASKNLPGQKPYLHLMALVDLSNFLYPGITKVRIACPLTTYHHEEALLFAGLDDSYYFPKPKIVEKPAAAEKAAKADKKGKKKGGSKKSKSSKSSKSSKKSKSSKGSKKSKKSKKSSKSGDDKSDQNLKNALPAEPIPPPPPEPSIKVFNEEGNRTFVIVEIELSEPLSHPKPLEDLQKDLAEMINIKPTVSPPNPLNTQIIREYSEKLLKEIVVDLNRRFAQYCEDKKVCRCNNQADFLTYLRRTGGYQDCISSLTQIAAVIVNKKLHINLTYGKMEKIYEEIFLFLLNSVHDILNRFTRNCGFPGGESRIQTNTATLHFYAKEAMEVHNLKLANRYFLERLSRNFENPNFWFDYAVFNVELQETEKAFIHLRDALSRAPNHRNSLVMIALLLAENGKFREAETCLLTVMVQEPRWVEGWTTLYLFYKDTNNPGGTDLSLEMATKYIDEEVKTDYFMEFPELSWEPGLFPKTIFFRVAVFLLRMRMFKWVERALSFELKEAGLVHYMLAIVCYFKRDYVHSLNHLEEARKIHGSDYPVVSLCGHCYMAMGRYDDAILQYSYILESYERPSDVHLLYVNYARIIKDPQVARKMLLLACRNHPTPYTWLRLGILFFDLNDYISAEECFSESVALDNCAPDGWGFLTVINLKFKRVGEAEFCYGVALKNHLADEVLLKEIHDGFNKLKVV